MQSSFKGRFTIGKKIFLIILGLFLCSIMLEIGLRAGGFILLSIQERRNKISLKQKGTYRIMCLGESTTSNAWPPFLEQILNEKDTGVKFSVIDKGVSGTHLNSILMQLEDNLEKYMPDMVIAMVGINDEPRSDIITYNDTDFFLKNLRIYKLVSLLWLHIRAKAKEISGMHKTDLERKADNPYSSSNPDSPADEIKTTDPNKIEQISKEGDFQGIFERKNDDKTYFKLAERCFKKGNYAEAEKLFNKVIEINPKNDKAYLKLGLCYEIGLYKNDVFSEKVFNAFSKAIEVNPNNDGAYFQLGLYNEHLKVYDKAVEMYKNAIKINPIDESSYFGLASCYRRLNKNGNAQESLKELLRVNPKNERAYGALAVIYEEEGNYDFAKEYSRKANDLRLNRKNMTVRQKFQQLHDVITQKGIKILFVQYPLRSVEPLKSMFLRKEGIIFIDNERIFKEALKNAKYEDYFIDNFAGEFGHCTEQGNKLLAENIAQTILKYFF